MALGRLGQGDADPLQPLPLGGGATGRAEAFNRGGGRMGLAFSVHSALVSFPAQPLLVKPKVSSRVLERRLLSAPFTQPAAPRARSRQTTIASFFCTQTGEGSALGSGSRLSEEASASGLQLQQAAESICWCSGERFGVPGRG